MSSTEQRGNLNVKTTLEILSFAINMITAQRFLL